MIEISHVIARPLDFSFSESPELLARKAEKNRVADLYTRTTKYVCEPCNNGWMSNLQKTVQPHILSLIKNETFSQSEADCSNLAKWAAMTSTTHEYRGRIISSPQRERAGLMEGQIPIGLRVFVTLMSDAKWAGHQRFTTLRLATATKRDGSPVIIRLCYFCIEQVAFICTIADSREALLYIAALMPDFQDWRETFNLGQIWPVAELKQPDRDHRKTPADLDLIVKTVLEARTNFGIIPL